jgi:hypothetical protein
MFASFNRFAMVNVAKRVFAAPGTKFQARKLIGSSVTPILTRSVVTIAEAKKAPRHYNEMSNDVLSAMAASGDQEAREERLVREIMAVDNIDWHEAHHRFERIAERNRSGLFIATLPYKFGVFTAVTAGFCSIPMIFHLDTVMWFNELYVTSDVPEEKDLETPLEVGSWAWNWMEPPLGQISFFLLCMQYARAQLENLGAKPYTAAFLARRAARLCKEFPQYNSVILTSFSEGDPLTPEPIDKVA